MFGNKGISEGFTFFIGFSYLISLSRVSGLSENVLVTVHTKVYSGLMNYVIGAQNNFQKNTLIKGNEMILNINTTSNNKLFLMLNYYVATYYVLYFTVNEQISKEQLNVGISNVYHIQLNEKKEFLLSQSSFSDNQSILMNLKSDNCYFKIESSPQTEIYSNEPLYHQIIFKEVTECNIQIQIDNYIDTNNTNPNDICNFYIYGTNINEDEDFLICFNSVTIKITSSLSTAFWLVIIFLFVLSILLFGTYQIYKEIKQREKDIPSKQLIFYLVNNSNK